MKARKQLLVVKVDCWRNLFVFFFWAAGLTKQSDSFVVLPPVGGGCRHQGRHQSDSALLIEVSSTRISSATSDGAAVTKATNAGSVDRHKTANEKKNSNDDDRVGKRFTAPPMQVFIEDTDAYDVVYNSNYLRFYDRALHMIMEQAPFSAGPDESNTNDNWSIVAVQHQRFLSSPPLGGSFLIEGALRNYSGAWELWDMTMTSLDHKTIYNTVAGLLIAKPKDSTNGLVETTLSSFPIGEKTMQDLHLQIDHNVMTPESTATTRYDTFRTYRDEYDAHLAGRLPLRHVLNLFERARTNYLGGPDILRELQMEHNLLFVVTKMEHGSLLLDPNELTAATMTVGSSTTYLCRPGRQELLTVETSCVIKRRGMVVEYYQILKAAHGQRLAQAKITLMTLDAITFRPTSRLPRWLQERAGIIEASES